MASEVAMATVPKKIALPDTLKGLAVNPHTGLTRAEVDIRRMLMATTK
jgi:hypothetical protein